MTRTQKAPKATFAAPMSSWASVRTQADYKRVLNEQRDAGAVYSPAALDKAMLHASSTLRLYSADVDHVSQNGPGDPRFDERITAMESGAHADEFDPAHHELEPEPGPPSAPEAYAALRARAVAGELVRPAELHAAKMAAEAAELADEIAVERAAREQVEDANRRERRRESDPRIAEALGALDDAEIESTAQAVRDALAEHRTAVNRYNVTLAKVRTLVDIAYPGKPRWGDSEGAGFHPDRHSFHGSQTFVRDGVTHEPRRALTLAP